MELNRKAHKPQKSTCSTITNDEKQKEKSRIRQFFSSLLGSSASVDGLADRHDPGLGEEKPRK
jgi:hypothetical protein